MSINREEVESLHAEAKRVRKNYRYILQDLKRTPENIDLLRQRDRLQKRYKEIQRRLAELRDTEKALPEDPADGHPDSPAVDMSIFEPKPFEIPAAVPVDRRPARTAVGGSSITFKQIRIAIAVALLLVMLPFFYLYGVRDMRFFEVPTRSMEPTLQEGDRIVAIRPSRYHRGDIVVLIDPENPGDYLVKRLVAFGGDVVEVANGTLLVNNQPIIEPYVKEPMAYAFGPYTVRHGDVFLLGDNRNNSDDSHVWQAGRPEAELHGRVYWIYAPSGRRGGIEDHTSVFAEVITPAE